MRKITIDVYSDVVCPWCFLGKHQLEKALDGLKGELEAELRWLPFELRPDTPSQGRDHKAELERKMGGAENLKAAHDRLKSLGKDLGISYDFDAIQKTPNTFDAHRLVWWAERQGQGEKVERLVEALFKAHFSEGRFLGDRGLLAGIAGQCGLDEGEALRFLESREGVEEVRHAEEEGVGLGVEGVPFVVLEGRYAVSGAQGAPAFEQAIREVSRLSPSAGKA